MRKRDVFLVVVYGAALGVGVWIAALWHLV